MKKVLFIPIVATLVFHTTATPLHADVSKGQKIYKLNFRKACGKSGIGFSHIHYEDKWTEFYKNGTLPAEAKKICPKLDLDKIQPSWWEHIYDFCYKYAKGKGVPAC